MGAVGSIGGEGRQMVNVQQLKRRYPSPVKGNVRGSGTYCVGGAFVLETLRSGLFGENGYEQYIGLRTYEGGCFPPAEAIARALVIVQPALDHDRADIIARYIVAANDSGEFDRAWEYLDDGLRGEVPEAIVVTRSYQQLLKALQQMPGPTFTWLTAPEAVEPSEPQPKGMDIGEDQDSPVIVTEPAEKPVEVPSTPEPVKVPA
jgi:hypothetical protein